MTGESPPPEFSEHPAAVLRRLQQRARKRFGQHFLADRAVVRRIVALADVGAGASVVEIGPGLGVLTRALLATGAAVTAVELDRDLAQLLREDLPALRLVEADALRVDWSEVAPGEGHVLCANLPYNVGTTLVTGLVQAWPRFHRLVVMLQDEVALRMVASPGSGAYGSLSVHVQAHAVAEGSFLVPPGAFHPPPKVQSRVVALRLRPEAVLGGASPGLFEAAVRAGFSQRRKTLENALTGRFGRERARAVVAATVGERRRAETLSLEEWGRLARALEEAC